MLPRGRPKWFSPGSIAESRAPGGRTLDDCAQGTDPGRSPRRWPREHSACWVWPSGTTRTPAAEAELSRGPPGFAGLVGMIDPPREEVKNSGPHLQRGGDPAGHDHRRPSGDAPNIARELGIFGEGGRSVPGSEFDRYRRRTVSRGRADLGLCPRLGRAQAENCPRLQNESTSWP